ncbi:MAG: phosphoesterase, partial [Clostridiales bacterium]|nr:phosphoesterase [Clostridiales bacterium]
VKHLDGIFIPSHVDKDTYSIISNLGFIPDYLDIKTLEYANYDKINKCIKLGLIKDNYRLIKNSDSHNLWSISEKENYLDVDEISVENILNLLK